MKLLSWNVRGLGRMEKRSKVKKLLKERSVDMVLFQETKKSEFSEEDVRSVWVRAKMEFMVVDAEASAGGLLCIWDLDVFQVKECCNNRRFILLSGTLFHQFNCVIINIYASNDVGSRGKLWNCLLKLKEEFPDPWCLGGDFNEIRQIGERRGCSRRDRGMNEFNEFIDKCEVSELPLLGRRFTWCNSFVEEKWSKIDRVLVDPKWLEVFKLKLWGLPRLVSDHCPLLMMEDERDWGPKPFRVLNAWFLHKNHRRFWESKWEEATVVGWAGFILAQKLKFLKNGLKSWNVEVFGNVINKWKLVEGELHSFDLLAEVRDLDGEEKMRKGELVFDDPSQVKSKVLEFFKLQYAELWPSRPVLGGQFPSVEGRVCFGLLEAEFTESEIKSTVMDCDGNKAPGLDGFNLLCYQKFWKVMKGDVINFVKEFHTNGKLVKGINSSFITLIPKRDNPLGLSDYRPISLVGSMYKIIAKLLANRLKSIMPHIISEPQSAFLSGRNILDGVLVANEVVEG
ncbi:uncharacterized protein LOC114299551 [Camellia sinensis]|uniref:uncharacterized protein LOC114299551 n=1 Tax=Camellia sinensis TaxID=4442 RepID=UPI001035849C|nr:uncharacterized protein LOC114299551 [Camellia sinensis]